MIEIIHIKKKGYSIINNKESEPKNDISFIILKSILFLITTVILISVLYFYSINNSYINESKPKQIINKNTLQDNMTYFLEILPKIDLEKKSDDIILEEIFNARKIYINEKNVTNDYIHFIKPINQEEENQYKQILYKDILYDDYPNEKREGQMSVNDFYNLCNKDKLIDSKTIERSDKPDISIIISILYKSPEIIRSINSIQSQTFKNIEIIIVDDFSESNEEILEQLYTSEPRLRLFKHLKKMGLWRSRMDGFLYSRGKYILHFDPGDILSDNFVLEDYYRFVSKYNLDTIRFSFTNPQNLDNMKIYPTRHTKIIYGRPDYNVHEYGYGIIWNRLIRTSLFTKALDLIDIYLLNANKNLWEDIWWNDLIDRVSFSNLILNKLGHINYHDRNSLKEIKISNNEEKDKTIREFIYNWFFDYELLPHDDNKTIIIDKLKEYSQINNTFFNLQINLDYLNTYFPDYKQFLTKLFKDPFIQDEEKILIKKLYNKAPKSK